MRYERATEHPLQPPAVPLDGGLSARAAGFALLASAALGAAGAVCLVGMFAGFAANRRAEGLVLGSINDALAVVTYPLLVPAILVVRPVLRSAYGGAGDVATAVGLGAVAGITGLQLLLVAGVLPFEQQIGPVSVAFLVLGAYFVLLGRAGGTRGLPVGPGLGVAAGLYFGYPLLALRLGRHLAAR
jgi:hypothetical protein